MYIHVYNYVHVQCTSRKGYAIFLKTYFHLQIHVLAFCTEMELCLVSRKLLLFLDTKSKLRVRVTVWYPGSYCSSWIPNQIKVLLFGIQEVIALPGYQIKAKSSSYCLVSRKLLLFLDTKSKLRVTVWYPGSYCSSWIPNHVSVMYKIATYISI